MSGAALELKGVTRSWKPGNPVFRGLDLEVPRRGITVLLGPSGCGKSTLLRCAASLDSPDEGTVLVDGHHVFSPSPERQLILQSDNQLLPWLTVEQNILFPGRHARRSPGAEGNTGLSPVSLLEDVGLPGHEGSYPTRLSGGMRQRAVLARALAARPSVLLLDEPFAALDTIIRTRLQQLLLTLRKSRPVAMLLVTHDVSEALTLADRLLFMSGSGVLSQPEENPLGSARDPKSMEFFKASIRMKRRYEELIDPI